MWWPMLEDCFSLIHRDIFFAVFSLFGMFGFGFRFSEGMRLAKLSCQVVIFTVPWGLVSFSCEFSRALVAYVHKRLSPFCVMCS